MKNAILEKLAEVVQGPFGYPRWSQRELDPTLPAYSIAGRGDSILSGAIQCLIVGMEEEAKELLAKSDLLMTTALQRALAGESIQNEEACHFYLAQCRWLAGPPAIPPDLSRACRLLNESAATATRHTFPDVFEWVLPRWLDAEKAEECVTAFERFQPAYPPARRRHHSPAAMSYLLARQRVRHTLSGTELVKLADDFLARQVPDFLINGWYLDYARWVKLITGADSGPAARAAIREIAERYTADRTTPAPRRST